MTSWQVRGREIAIGTRALVMGIVNVTPDSFSDGGQFVQTEAAIAHALELARQGADILDVGGESTRPGAEPVPVDEELRRVLPVIAGPGRAGQDADVGGHVQGRRWPGPVSRRGPTSSTT